MGLIPSPDCKTSRQTPLTASLEFKTSCQTRQIPSPEKKEAVKWV